MKQLWGIALRAQNTDVSLSAIHYLNNYYINCKYPGTKLRNEYIYMYIHMYMYVWTAVMNNRFEYQFISGVLELASSANHIARIVDLSQNLE